MIAFANRTPVARGHEAASEERFRGRASLVERRPAFRRFQLLRPRKDLFAGPNVLEMHGVLL
jgi:heme-degrading monooxygenase HmoA